MNKVSQKTLAFQSIVVFVLSLLCCKNVFADNIAHTFIPQLASGIGSNGSVVSIQSGGTPDASLKYINKGDNSSVLGNYFSGYYYDSMLGIFKVDALLNRNENVRIVGSTSKCPSGYGYKIGGYAYSENFGFIDFDFDSNTYVYYCVFDQLLHGYAYSDVAGFQNFEGISFPISVDIEKDPSDIPTQTGDFVNDDVEILDDNLGVTGSASAENSNFGSQTIQNDIFNFEVDKESLFYIIK